MRIAIIAALPGELKPLVRDWLVMEKLPPGMRMWQRPHGAEEVIAVCAGMGAAAARRAFAAAEFGGPLDLVLSVGWAGGLQAWNDEKATIVSEVIDAETGERFPLAKGERTLRLVTTARVADSFEKTRLAATYGAALVDMEAAAVARLAQVRGIPMVCIKAVSDDVAARLPDLNPFIDASGGLMQSKLLVHIAVRPQFWGSLIALGKRSAKAAKALAETVEQFLLEKNFDRVNRTGEV